MKRLGSAVTDPRTATTADLAGAVAAIAGARPKASNCMTGRCARGSRDGSGLVPQLIQRGCARAGVQKMESGGDGLRRYTQSRGQLRKDLYRNRRCAANSGQWHTTPGQPLP